MSLIAKHVEGLGTPPVCMSTGYDILVQCQPPRAVFLDYPMGITVGRPSTPEEQYAITRTAGEALETIQKPGAIVRHDHVWSEDVTWKIEAADANTGDIRQPRDPTSRYQFEEDRIAAEKSSSGVE